MKRILLTLLCSFAMLTAMAAPANRGPHKFTQPDGTVITFYSHGDEFFNYVTDSLGNVLAQNDVGFLVPTGELEHSESFRTRRAKALEKAKASVMRRTIEAPSFPSRVLVVLAQYKDVKFDPANTRAAFDDLFNKEGYDYNGATGSVRDYFREQSHGQYVPQFDVVGPYTLSHNQAYYGG